MVSWKERIAESIAKGEVPAGIAKHMGMRSLSGGDGTMELEMDSDERHFNPLGTVHGGVFCDLSDACMGLAFATTLEPGESFTTVELKINYLKPAWKTALRAKAQVVKRGRTLGLIDCDVFDGDGALLARASSTCMVLRGEQARGR